MGEAKRRKEQGLPPKQKKKEKKKKSQIPLIHYSKVPGSAYI